MNGSDCCSIIEYYYDHLGRVDWKKNVVNTGSQSDSLAHVITDYTYKPGTRLKEKITVQSKASDDLIVKDTDGVASANPIRWKSLYYDTESGLYYIDGRYYSPETRQFLSPVPAETMLGRAVTVFGLNPYLIALDNCVNKLYNEYTANASVELAFDPEQMTAWTWFWSVAWPRFWNSDIGKTWSLILFVGALFLTAGLSYVPCVGAMAWIVFAETMVTSAVGFFVNATIAGLQSASMGGDFREGFADYITNNWSQTLAITSLICIVSVGVQTAAYLNAKTQQELANAAIVARDSKVAELRNTLSKQELRKVATVVGGYNKSTEQVAVGVKYFDRLPYCAETEVVKQLGGMQALDDIVMTPAIRPYNMKIIPVCEYCQTVYSMKNFVKGIIFKEI